MIGLIGKKVGMTRVFLSDGEVVAVTVIVVGDNRVVGLRTQEKNRYEAVTIGSGVNRKEKRKTLLHGFHDKKRPQVVREFRIDKRFGERIADYSIGQSLPVTSFKVGDILDISGVSIGKGFQGVIRRFGMSGGPASHGSRFHRHPGSIGHCTEPARVFKGKHLPGRMGGDTVTVQNLELIDVDEKNNLLIVRGAVPGKRNGMLIIRGSVKKTAKPKPALAAA